MISDAPADGAALDAKIRTLVTARAEMSPGPSISPPTDPAQMYRADNMLWHVRPAPDAAAIELSLYHPGLGWVSVLMSRAQVEDLGDAIAYAVKELPMTVNKPVVSKSGVPAP